MARRQGTTTERLGRDHAPDRKRLLAALRDGEPCWRCGQPMYRTQKLDRDHVIDRALGGTEGPAVLSHASCNRSAGGRLGHQIYPYALAAFTAPPATCKICGKHYKRPAQTCEMCGAHYHPSYGAPGEQRTCGRVCGLALKQRNKRAAGWVPKAERPRPPRKLGPVQSGQRDPAGGWPSSAIQHYTCRYCGEHGVTRAMGGERTACPARPCQLARITANNLRARNGLTKDEADTQAATMLATGAIGQGRWQTARRW